MKTKKLVATITPVRSQLELRKHTPSALFRSALYRSGAGIHADNADAYGKRDRAKNRREERDALLTARDG